MSPVKFRWYFRQIFFPLALCPRECLILAYSTHNFLHSRMPCLFYFCVFRLIFLLAFRLTFCFVLASVLVCFVFLDPARVFSLFYFVGTGHFFFSLILRLQVSYCVLSLKIQRLLIETPKIPPPSLSPNPIFFAVLQGGLSRFLEPQTSRGDFNLQVKWG